MKSNQGIRNTPKQQWKKNVFIPDCFVTDGNDKRGKYSQIVRNYKSIKMRE